MKAWSYGVLVATLVGAATLVRLYGPNNYSLTVISAGIERGVPVKIVTFWVLMTIAIVVALFGLFRRRTAG